MLSLLLLAITKLRARLGQCCENCTMGLFWERYCFFYWLLQSCTRDWVSIVSNCTMGLFWERYRFFYLLLQSCARDWVSVVSNCTMGLFWECYHFFYWLFTKLRARLGQCCVKLHCGIVWERYRFFYWLLRSCAGNWFGVNPNQHHGIVVGMLSFPLRPLKRLPQRLSLKHNLQMAQTERSEKGIDEHISPQKICPKSNQHQCSPNINMH